MRKEKFCSGQPHQLPLFPALPSKFQTPQAQGRVSQFLKINFFMYLKSPTGSVSDDTRWKL